MTKITRVEIRDVLMDVNTSRYAGFHSITNVRMNQYDQYWIEVDGKRKKNKEAVLNPYYEQGIKFEAKKYKINTGFDYEHSLEGRAKNEGIELDRTQPRKEPWFIALSRALVTDKATGTKFYFRYQYCDKSIRESKYWFGGNEIDRRFFEQYMIEKTDYSKYQGGLEKPLPFQVCDLDNIISIAIDKEQYELID